MAAVRGRIPAEIAQLRERIEEWRRTRLRHGPMPADLWAAAVAVARKHGLYDTARGMGIDYGSLAKRMKEEPPVGAAGSLAKVEFVEWSGAELLGQVSKPAGAVVEMSDTSGRRVTIHLGGAEPVDVAGIVAAFYGSRP
jgi:hypothetical protein